MGIPCVTRFLLNFYAFYPEKSFRRTNENRKNTDVRKNNKTRMTFLKQIFNRYPGSESGITFQERELIFQNTFLILFCTLFLQPFRISRR